MAMQLKDIMPNIVVGINVVVPGGGTILTKHVGVGVLQLVLWVVGWLAQPLMVMIVLLAGSWLWAQYTSLRMLRSG